MPRLKCLLKLGALGSVVIGVVRFMKRRRQKMTSESSWPTLADTAAEQGHPVDTSTEHASAEGAVDETPDDLKASDDPKAADDPGPGQADETVSEEAVSSTA